MIVEIFARSMLEAEARGKRSWVTTGAAELVLQIADAEETYFESIPPRLRITALGFRSPGNSEYKVRVEMTPEEVALLATFMFEKKLLQIAPPDTAVRKRKRRPVKSGGA